MRNRSNLAVALFLLLFAFSFAFGAVALVPEEAGACCRQCNCFCIGGKGILDNGVCKGETCHWYSECVCQVFCYSPPW